MLVFVAVMWSRYIKGLDEVIADDQAGSRDDGGHLDPIWGPCSPSPPRWTASISLVSPPALMDRLFSVFLRAIALKMSKREGATSCDLVD